jgi:hypothetical protein
MDANAFVLASMLGPFVAAGCIAVLGPATGMVAIAIPFGLAALALRGVRDPETGLDRERPLLSSAWEGLRYTLSHPTLRGLAVAIVSLTFVGGVVSIVVPLLVLDHLGGSELVVGLVFGLSGIAGLASVLVVGRRDTRGREWALILIGMIFQVPATAVLWLAGGALGVTAPLLGFSIIACSLVLTGLLEGPLSIGMFTMRQRRTDPAWFGRAFAISMAINALGFPIGAALAGGLAEVSIDLAILVGVIAAIAATFFAALFIPQRDEPPGHEIAVRTLGTDAAGRGPSPEANAPAR